MMLNEFTGYLAVGILIFLNGVLADFFDLSPAITAAGAITLLSGLYIAVQMNTINAKPLTNG